MKWHDAPLLLAARQRWQGISARERMLVAGAGAALGLLLVWSLTIAPVLRTWREVPAQAAALEAEWLDMQRLASESRDLKSQAPVSTDQAGAALKTATEALGTHGTLALLGDRATLTLNSVTPDQLRTWLAEARQNAHARPSEAQINRDDSGLSGRLVVSLPSAKP